MNIKTEFKINQKVYVIFKEENEPYVKIFEDVIEEIVICKDEVKYYVKKICEEFKSEELVDVKDANKLIPKMKNLLTQKVDILNGDDKE